jgi:ATP-dependent Lon protease
MSADGDDINGPVEKDTIATGAAADSAESDEKLKQLPRLLRFAILSDRDNEIVYERLAADIAELAPGLTAATAWVGDSTNAELGMTLAVELDHLAVVKDKPDLRSLADCVRLLSLPIPVTDNHRDDHRRLTKALLQALRRLPARTDADLASKIEAIAFGWAALPVVDDALSRLANHSAGEAASRLGREMAFWRVTAAEASLRDEFEEKRARENAKARLAEAKEPEAATKLEAIPADHVIVCRMSESAAKNPKMKELTGPLKHVVNVALPLVPVPPLHEVRSKLLFEFPYAADVIDFALADLVGKTTIRLRPLLLVGDAGGGKSRFARRLGEVLNVGTWRTDASRSDGATFGGTDKRWHSAEPCHPFLAIAQTKHANPLILIDELEKAGTRSDYGRFWDCLLGFLEPETAARYPDPALQTALDLGHVSYVATANSLDPLPSPLRDRFRIVTFPKPGPEHLDVLLAPVIVDLAAERGLDQRWVEPLAGFERDMVAAHWRGGSVRKLRRVVEAVLRAREKAAVRN